MDAFSSRGSRQSAPQRESAVMQEPHRRNPETPVSYHASTNAEPPRRLYGKILLLVGGVILVVSLIVFLLWGMWSLFLKGSGVDSVKSNQYQAVFLTNGQVYFGKLRSSSDSFYTLSDVFYLQATQTDPTNPQKTADTSSNVQLIKLGNEVHGPEDSMMIDKRQVLFFENLKTDGKVAKTITDFNNKK